MTNPLSSDEILIEILDSGDIKITTDPVSGPNHMSAEGLLRTIAEIAGGDTQRVRRRSTKVQHKQHIHTHGHE
jgi:hypothetical protein